MSRRESAASRSKSSKAAGPRPRKDGKIDVSCPQCAAMYRVATDQLDQKIECQDCHRVFFAKTTAGKRAKPPDYTKVYVGFGVGAVCLIGIFIAMSGSEPKKTPPPVVEAPKAPQFSRGTHPRTVQLVAWAQAISSNNELVMSTHSDLPAIQKLVEAPSSDSAAVVAALQSHDATKHFRELMCESGQLTADTDMTSATGTATVYLTPKQGDTVYIKNTRGEYELTFRMDGEQVKVTGFTMKMRPNRQKPEPQKGAYLPNADIQAPEQVTVSDSAGTRKVQESKPTPVPHWKKATPEQQAMADKVVADILASADPEAPGPLFSRTTLKVQSSDDKQAVVPRVLNAMYDCYADVNANNMKLSQLNRAMVIFTGYAVNYQVEPGDSAEKDRAARESCVRQWFAFWWRYHGDLSEFFDTREDLDAPLPEKPKKPAK